MKEKMKKIFAATLAGFMGMSFVACNGGVEPEGDKGASGTYSYLAIDINPSIEFMVNGETVVGVKACNDDASVLLSGENLENMSVEAATEKIVELAEELGYLNEENDDVKIVVTADSAELTATLEKLAENGVGKGSLLAKINNTPRLTDERQVNKLKDENGDKFKHLTAGKLRLIEAIMQYDETMTYEIGVEMSVSELSKMLDGYVDEMNGIVGEEMEELFEKKYKEIKKLYEAQIAGLYGSEYKAAWERFVTLERVAKDIERKAEKLLITAEDVESLMEILGMLDESQDENLPQKPETDGHGGAHGGAHGGHKKPELTEDGRLGLEDFEKFFDRHEDCCYDEDKYEEIFDKVEEILEAYDEDEYVLTEEDLAAITEAWGEAIEVTTLEELEDFLDDQEDALEELRESLENPVIESILKGIREQMKHMKDEAKGYMKAQMEASKAEFQARKDALRNK